MNDSRLGCFRSFATKTKCCNDQCWAQVILLVGESVCRTNTRKWHRWARWQEHR